MDFRHTVTVFAWYQYKVQYSPCCAYSMSSVKYLRGKVIEFVGFTVRPGSQLNPEPLGSGTANHIVLTGTQSAHILKCN